MACRSQTSLPGPEQPCRLRHDDYTVAIICPMGDELSPVLALLDESHEPLGTSRDQNAYKLGKMGHHNVVVAGMPEIGNNAAAMVVTQLLNDFGRIRFGLLVGIGGGIPDEDYDDDELNDIRLGDVVVSHSRGARGGVIQFDRGKSTKDGFVVTGHQSKPPHVLAVNVEILRASHDLSGNRISQYLDEMLGRYPGMRDKYSLPGSERDCVFEATYTHEGGKTCKKCDISRTIERQQRRTDSPRIHYGTIGSSNTVIKDSQKRNKLRDMGILCVEMEAAGLMEAFPCLVIRGISDYADSHKNKKWQPYAAATAAAYSKELLLQIPQGEVQRTQLVTNMLEGLTMKVDRVDERTRLLVGQTQSKTEMMVLEWLSSKDVNFSSLQNESQQTHTAGTGQWLLDHRSYQNWRDREPGLLWLHGVAGCGKTILCSTIIRDLQRTFSPLAYWYFRFDNHTSQNTSQMLRSIIRQLSAFPLPEEIHSLYNRHSQRASEPSLDDLVAALKCTIDRLAQDVYIVFDALDECPHQDKKGQRHELLDCVKSLNKRHSKLHLLVTSRPEPDIQAELRPVASCNLDIEEPIRSDVARFVKVTLKDPRLASWTEGVRDKITRKLLEYKESVPKDLEAAYRQAFDAIDDRNTAHVTKIMMWLAFSLEPLAADQIAAIAGFRNPDYVLQICSTLLVTIIDEDTTKIIKLAHFSVKEFLVLKTYETSTQWYRFTMEHANRSIALFTLEGLLQPQHQVRNILPYAARYWPQHAIEGLKIDYQMKLEKQICLLFSDKCRTHFLGWLKMHDPDNTNGFQGHRAAPPLYYAALLGFQSVVCKIWTDESRLSRNEGRYGNALNAAAINGNVAVVRWILRNCENAADFLDLRRVAVEIHANVTECIAEICHGPQDLKITKEVVQAAAKNESSGRQVMEVLLQEKGHEIQITERVVRAAAGNWDSGQQIMELLLKQRGDDIQITEEVVKTAFANDYSGWQVLNIILENKGNEPQVAENVIKAAIERGRSGQEVMELLLEKRGKTIDIQITEAIAILVVGNFNASTVRLLLDCRGDEVPITEKVVIAATQSHSYGPQVVDVLLEARGDRIELTEGVVMAAAKSKTRGQEVLEALLRRVVADYQITDAITSLIAGNFGAHAMELFLERGRGDMHLTEEVLICAAGNLTHGQHILEVLLSKKEQCVYHITEPVVRAAARNVGCGQQVIEFLLSRKADSVRISDKVFVLITCNWKEARVMELLSESIEDDAMEDRLATAENVKNMAAVEALQKRRDHPNAKLYLAISSGNVKAAEQLINDGARDSKDGWGSSLRAAAAGGFTDIVELLLRNGAEQTASETGKTPLMHASEKGSVDIAELLLMHGADVTMKSESGNTALNIAVRSNHLGVADLLLRSGSDPSTSSNWGTTPLISASRQGSVDIVALLLASGADHSMADKEGNRALDVAADEGHLDVLVLLLRRGADPLALDSFGRTALMCASQRGFTRIAELLLQNGADLTTTNKNGNTALNRAALEGHLEMANLLIKHDADLKVADKNGHTALHNAAFKGHVEMANLLINNGADLALSNGFGWTALHFASYTENIRMIELLLRNSASTAIKDTTGRTALHYASYHGHVDAVNMLIEYDANISAVDNFGCTPLHLASGEGRTEVVELLSSMDPDMIVIHDAYGFTAAEAADRMGHTDIVALLRSKRLRAVRQKDSMTTSAEIATDTCLHHETGPSRAVPKEMYSGTSPNPDDVHDTHKVSGAIRKLKSFWSRP
ncbi:hypothetical protein G7054_g2214 [Neopestalotiopsis clavispora]|nr:hypothetical protein G7054_g2214 [Neopestalotiopsis clavispora]